MTMSRRTPTGTVTFRETRDYISIATTRPETMLGDGAVAVHPDDARYAPIVGKLCEIPVGPKAHRRLIPIITDDYPDPTFGSGAVKITGAHDFNDYAVASRNGIPMYRLMDTRGQMRDDGAPYAEEAEKAQAISRGWLVRKGYVPAGIAEQPATAGRGRNRRDEPGAGRIPRARPVRGAQARRRRYRRRGADDRGRGQEDHAAVRRPLESGGRADADRPVVRRCREAGARRRWRR